MKNKFYKFGLAILLVLGINISMQAQDRKVTGKVAGGDGAGIPGATILLKGTAVGTTSDANGSFGINVKTANDILVISSIGFKTQEVQVGNRSTISIDLLEDASQLGEVIVTGYATQRKKDITGAVTVVSAKELTALPTASVTQMLQGRAAGVTVGNDNSPGGGTMVRIRGFGSINNNSPLYG